MVATVNPHPSFHRVSDAADPYWDALMAIYELVFQEGEKEPRPSLEAQLSTQEDERRGGHIVLAALHGGRTCVGGVIFSYLEAVNCGYISYLMVRPDTRRRGIGRELFYAARSVLDRNAYKLARTHAEGVFTELERESSSDPHTYERFQFWERLGVRPLDVEWEYPELAPGRRPLEMYLAYGSFTSRRHWTPPALADAVNEIFLATYAYLPGAEGALARLRYHLACRQPDLPIPYRILTYATRGIPL